MQLAVHRRVPAAEIRSSLATSVKQVTEWFQKNPDRRLATIEVWQGHVIKVKRHSIYEDVWAASERIIHENRLAGFVA